MSISRSIYLLLAVFGLVMTWYYNLQFIADSGGSFDVMAFIAAGATNAAAAGRVDFEICGCCIDSLFIQCQPPVNTAQPRTDTQLT
jgi:hypothetical protein